MLKTPHQNSFLLSQNGLVSGKRCRFMGKYYAGAIKIGDTNCLHFVGHLWVLIICLTCYRFSNGFRSFILFLTRPSIFFSLSWYFLFSCVSSIFSVNEMLQIFSISYAVLHIVSLSLSSLDKHISSLIRVTFLSETLSIHQHPACSTSFSGTVSESQTLTFPPLLYYVIVSWKFKKQAGKSKINEHVMKFSRKTA